MALRLSNFVRRFATIAPRLDSASSSTTTASTYAAAATAQGTNELTTHAPEQQRLYKTDLAHVSGQPPAQAARKVLISSPGKTAMQSGTYQTRYWKIDFDTQDRWENPVMGWTSSADPLQAIDMTLRFESKEAAVRFAEQQGWEAEVKEPHRRHVNIKRTYADNFKYEPNRLRFVKTK